MEFPDLGLWEWFRTNAMPWFKTLFESLVKSFFWHLRGLFTAFKVGLIFAFGIITATVWALIQIQSTLDNLDLATLAKPAAAMLHYYSFMNRFLPLAEGFAGAVICFDVWLVFIIIRWIKSFVPTISN